MAKPSSAVIVGSVAVAGCVVGIGVGMVLAKRGQNVASQEGELPMFALAANVDVHIVDGMEQLQRLSDSALEKLSLESLVVVGLDTEWARGKRLALLQIALPGACWLLRLRRLAVRNSDGVELFSWPASFVRLLVHPSMLYTGSGIKQDLALVKDQLGIDLSKFVELQTVARRESLDNVNGIGLQGLTKTVLGRSLCKDPAIRCGDWEAEPLSRKQVDYAAADAMVGREILLTMHARSNSGTKAGDDLATWLVPLLCKSNSKKQRITQGGAIHKASDEKSQSVKIKKGKRVPTEAESLEKAGWEAAAIARARQPHAQGSARALPLLSDLALMPGLAVRASSSAPGLSPQNCLAHSADKEWFLPALDWRAERRAAVSFGGPTFADVELGRSCHWLELEFPAGVRPSVFALRCTASAACRTNGPTSWLLQAAPDAEPQAAEWVTLHAAGVFFEPGSRAAEPGPGGAPEVAAIAPAQEWNYDTAYFSNGDIPGDTRFFQLSPETVETVYRRFRWTFLSEAKAFSVNLSGVLLFGRSSAA